MLTFSNTSVMEEATKYLSTWVKSTLNEDVLATILHSTSANLS